MMVVPMQLYMLSQIAMREMASLMFTPFWMW